MSLHNFLINLVLTNIHFVIIILLQANTMRTKQNYCEKITQEQNNTSQFEEDEFDSSNSDSSESSTSHSDSSESESSIKNKKVSLLYTTFRFCRVLPNIFFYSSYHNRQTQ